MPQVAVRAQPGREPLRTEVVPAPVSFSTVELGGLSLGLAVDEILDWIQGSGRSANRREKRQAQGVPAVLDRRDLLRGLGGIGWEASLWQEADEAHVRFARRDVEEPGISWRSVFRLKRFGDGNSLRVEHATGRVGHPRNAPPAVTRSPNVVASLCAIPGVSVLDDSLLRPPLVLGPDDVGAFVREVLVDPLRRHPFVLVSPERWTEAPLVDPAALATLLACQVPVVELLRDAPRRLAAAFAALGFEREYGACFDGAVRLYQRGLEPRGSPREHYLWMGSRIREFEALGRERLAGEIAERAARQMIPAGFFSLSESGAPMTASAPAPRYGFVASESTTATALLPPASAAPSSDSAIPPSAVPVAPGSAQAVHPPPPETVLLAPAPPAPSTARPVSIAPPASAAPPLAGLAEASIAPSAGASEAVVPGLGQLALLAQQAALTEERLEAFVAQSLAAEVELSAMAEHLRAARDEYARLRHGDTARDEEVEDLRRLLAFAEARLEAAAQESDESGRLSTLTPVPYGSTRRLELAEPQLESLRWVLRYGEPQCLEDALHLLEAAFGEHVVILPSAWKSARESFGFQKPAKALELMLVLVDDYRNTVRVKGDTAAKDCFTDSTFAPRESETVQNNRGARARRTFQYNGEDVVMWKHLRIGVKDSVQTWRLHFEYDPTTDRIVIGHCGKHLDFH